MPPNLKIALPMTPASTSPPIMTSNSIWTEPDCISDDRSTAAEVATAGSGACSVFNCTASPELSVAGAGLTDELTPDGSGQREAMTDSCVFASGAFAAWPFSTLAAFAVVAGVRWQADTLGCCSTCVCGKGSSACASATGRCVAVSFWGEAGSAIGAVFCGLARESFSRWSPRYQQWRLL